MLTLLLTVIVKKFLYDVAAAIATVVSAISSDVSAKKKMKIYQLISGILSSKNFCGKWGGPFV
jgi:acetylglutamate synthase